MIEALERSSARGELGQFSFVEHLYGGLLEDYIECKSCGLKRARRDKFNDVQLVIRDIDSVVQALDKFVEPEVLSGDNRWFCEHCNGKVDALKV